MTQKDFKETCNIAEYGKGINKRNAIYFDRNTQGYKYMVKCGVDVMKRAELLKLAYTWFTEGVVHIPYNVKYRFAESDNDRFKVSLMG